MELSREDSKMLQGLAVMAMVALHLFNRNDYQGLFQPLVFIKGIPLSFYIGQLSDFCVFGFAFCSGYAHMKMCEQQDFYKRRLKGLARLLIKYWIIIAVFSIISIIIGSSAFMPGSLMTLLGNVFLFDISYNGAWWYMWVYALIVLISPLILKFVKKAHPVLVLAIGFVVYCAAYYVRFDVQTANYFVSRFGPFGMTVFEYLVGCVCYKIQFFSRLHKKWAMFPPMLRTVISVFILVGLLLFRTLGIQSLFVAPFSGMLIITIFQFWEKPELIKKLFLLVGEHSTTIWLTHMFFYLYLFKNLVYSAQYPLLIFCFMLLITISISTGLEFIERPLFKKLF